MEEYWTPQTLLLNMQNGSSALENSLVVPTRVKHRVIIWPSSSTPSYISPQTETCLKNKQNKTKICTQMLITVLFIVAKSGNNSNIHQPMNV